MAIAATVSGANVMIFMTNQSYLGKKLYKPVLLDFL